jgi:hypothetical protein
MLDVKQKQFITIMVLVALILSNLVLFVLWNEAKANVEVVKENAINELVKCGCEGYWRGVPFIYDQKDFNISDLNFVYSMPPPPPSGGKS